MLLQNIGEVWQDYPIFVIGCWAVVLLQNNFITKVNAKQQDKMSLASRKEASGMWLKDQDGDEALLTARPEKEYSPEREDERSYFSFFNLTTHLPNGIVAYTNV